MPVKIVSVSRVEGRTLNPRWNNEMQLIQTDAGDFYIDNLPDVQVGDNPPGFKWEEGMSINVTFRMRNRYTKFDWITPCVLEPPPSPPPPITTLPPDGSSGLITSTKLRKKLGIGPRLEDFYKEFAKIGYLEKKSDEQYALTNKGIESGADRWSNQDGTTYFVWPENISVK